MLWVFSTQTDKNLECRLFGIVVLDKKKKEYKINNLSVPGDENLKS